MSEKESNKKVEKRFILSDILDLKHVITTTVVAMAGVLLAIFIGYNVMSSDVDNLFKSVESTGQSVQNVNHELENVNRQLERVPTYNDVEKQDENVLKKSKDYTNQRIESVDRGLDNMSEDIKEVKQNLRQQQIDTRDFNRELRRSIEDLRKDLNK